MGGASSILIQGGKDGFVGTPGPHKPHENWFKWILGLSLMGVFSAITTVNHNGELSGRFYRKFYIRDLRQAKESTMDQEEYKRLVIYASAGVAVMLLMWIVSQAVQRRK